MSVLCAAIATNLTGLISYARTAIGRIVAAFRAKGAMVSKVTIDEITQALEESGLIEGQTDYESREKMSGGFLVASAPHGVGVTVLFPNPAYRKFASKTLEDDYGYRAGFMEKSGPPYRLWVWRPGEFGGSANPDEEV